MTEVIEPPVRRQEYNSPLFNKPTHHCTTSTPRLHVFNDPLPNPASTVASLTRELEDTLHTLDLQAAMRGQYVVKPQVFTVCSTKNFNLHQISKDSEFFKRYENTIKRANYLKCNKISSKFRKFPKLNFGTTPCALNY